MSHTELFPEPIPIPTCEECGSLIMGSGCAFCSSYAALVDDLRTAALKFSRGCGETVAHAQFYYDRDPLAIDIDLGDRYGTAVP